MALRPFGLVALRRCGGARRRPQVEWLPLRRFAPLDPSACRWALSCLRVAVLVLCCCIPLTARAEGAVEVGEPSPHVVLLETTGSHAWFAAQQRLAAELQAVGMRLTLLRAANQLDPRLPRYAQAFDAVAAVQVLRLGDSGVVRLWLSRRGKRPGGYRHIRVNLRGPDVVSRAVLLAVEVIFSRALEPEMRRSSEPVVGPSALSLPPRPAVLGFLWGGGPSWVDVRTNPGWIHTVGASVRLLPQLALQAEWSLSLTRQQLEISDGSKPALRMQRVGLMSVWHPWPQSAPRSGLGLGLAVARLDPAEPRLEARALAPMFTFRTQHVFRFTERVGVLLASTASLGLGNPVVGGSVLRPGVDLFLGLDWNVW